MPGSPADIKALPGRLKDNTNLENTDYQGVLTFLKTYQTTRSCLEEVLDQSEENPGIIAQVPQLKHILNESKEFLDSASNEFNLSTDERLALALYTYDLGIGSKQEENFYFQLNACLRTRANGPMRAWQGYLHYLFQALSKLEDKKLTLYRGVNTDREAVKEQYKVGKKVHWSSFSSSTFDLSVAKRFAWRSKIIFRMKILNGKDILKYSVIKGEQEILLLPNLKLLVSGELEDDKDGYSYVDLTQISEVMDTHVF